MRFRRRVCYKFSMNEAWECRRLGRLSNCWRVKINCRPVRQTLWKFSFSWIFVCLSDLTRPVEEWQSGLYVIELLRRPRHLAFPVVDGIIFFIYGRWQFSRTFPLFGVLFRLINFLIFEIRMRSNSEIFGKNCKFEKLFGTQQCSFPSFQILLTLDDDLLYTPRDRIPVFWAIPILSHLSYIG